MSSNGFPTFTEDEVLRYSRHIILPKIGGAGQRKLLGEGRGHSSARTRTSTAKPTPNTIGSTIGGTNQLLITRRLPRPRGPNPR